MKAKTLLLGVVLPLSLFTGANSVYAGNACKNVTFQVTNDYGKRIKVTKFELWSRQEGRYLTENFRDTEVPKNAVRHVVRSGEKVENGEGDDITKIRVSFKEKSGSGWSGVITRIDNEIGHPECVAGKTYLATVNR